MQNIFELLGFRLHNLYFSYQNTFYEQVEGVAMGSPVSPILANWYMEHFEGEALRSASHPPGFGTGLWMTLGSSYNRLIKQLSLDHINSIDPSIKFMVKGNLENGAIPFLDTLVQQILYAVEEADNSLSIRVYHKPTHTDQYLQWDSHSQPIC